MLQDEKEIIHSIAFETGDTLVDSEEYLQPSAQVGLPSCSNIGIPVPAYTMPQNHISWDRDILRFTPDHYPSRLCSLKG